jgi:hypothetical protein
MQYRLHKLGETRAKSRFKKEAIVKSAWKLALTIGVGIVISAGLSSAAITDGAGWGQENRDMCYGLLWDQLTNRHYGGFNNALTWPGGWWDVGLGGATAERRSHANYKGFVLGAKNVQDPQYPAVVWPYMVGQRDGWNDGEHAPAYPEVAPDPSATADQGQILFKGRLNHRIFRQAWPVVTTDGIENTYLVQDAKYDTLTFGDWPQLVGDESDNPYKRDTFDPSIPADLMYETYSWSRMGISTNRMVYQFADRRNDDYMFWHWRMINDGLWGLMGVDKVDVNGATWGTVEGVMKSFMFQWDRNSAGANRTAGAGEANNDSIWRYYGVDYDGAQTEDMRLAYVVDGDQDPSKYNPDHGKQDDIGDPDPTTGELYSANAVGFQILHYDVSTSDRSDDVAQPRTVGWQNYNLLIRTSTAVPASDDGHEAKYNQMYLGYQAAPYPYQVGSVQTTPGRGTHPEAASFASWIKASNDPAVSGTYWPGKVLGVDPEVTDVESQFGFGPDDMAPNDTINGIYVVGVNGLDEQYAKQVGRQWLAGTITDEQKDALVYSSIDSLFATMRQAKDVYESATFGTGRYASTRDEFESALWAAIAAGKLALSPPAPATLTVTSGPGRVDLSWTLNTTTGSDIALWKVYRALADFKGDSAWVQVGEAYPGVTSWRDTQVNSGFSYYYYVTTVDADGNESTMQTRTDQPAVPQGVNAVFSSPYRFELSQNAPNPFNPSTTIRLSLAETGNTRLDVYNMNGQLVRTLIDGNMTAGPHEITWDGTDAVGRQIASGVYLYRLSAGENVQVRRMVLVR